MGVLLLNYAHPLTDEQLAQVVQVVGEEPDVREVPAQADRERPIAEVARALADAAGLSLRAWETTPLILNPPALAPLSLALIAELHGRCGGFPAMLNVRPVAGSVPTQYEVAEVVNLQALREAARDRRGA
jgi:hypothetical protein